MQHRAAMLQPFCPTWDELHAAHCESVLQDGLIRGSQLSRECLTRVPHNFATLTVWGLLMAQFKGLCATKKLIRPLLQVVCPSVAPESSGAQPGDYRKGLTCIIMHNINRTFQSFVCSNACDKSWDIKPNNHFVWGWRHTCCTSTKQCCTSLPCRNSACKGGGPRGFVCHLLPDVQDSAGHVKVTLAGQCALQKKHVAHVSPDSATSCQTSKQNQSTMKAPWKHRLEHNRFILRQKRFACFATVDFPSGDVAFTWSTPHHESDLEVQRAIRCEIQ